MGVDEFQTEVARWIRATFGDTVLHDKVERSDRFLEEALETVQAAGMDRDRVLMLVDYVFSRPVGEMHQEIGGAFITLLALAVSSGMSTERCALDELFRYYQKQDAIREKQKTKPRGSPLPSSSEFERQQRLKAGIPQAIAALNAN